MNRVLFAILMLTILMAQGSDVMAKKPEIGDLAELPEGAPLKMEKVTYLGVTAKPVDDAMRSQLNLPEDVGLTVLTVDHKGPAAADIRVNDVIQKLDDQLLINSEQLIALIHLSKPGDAVTLIIIRGGKAMPITVRLGEKLRAPKPKIEKTPDLTQWLDEQNNDPVRLGFNNQVSMSFKDDAYSASVKADAVGHKRLTVKNLADQVVAQGPVDTESEWNKFSPEIRKHLAVMHKMLFDEKKQP